MNKYLYVKLLIILKGKDKYKDIVMNSDINKEKERHFYEYINI